MKNNQFYKPPPSEIVIDSSEMPLAPNIELVFDYSIFDPETARAMQSHARKIKAKGQKIGAELIDIGGELAAAKERIEHGHWLNWLRDEHNLNERAAQRSIAVWREFKDQRQLASLFNPRVLELMAGRSTPAAAKQEIITQAQSTGRSPTKREVEAVISRHKPSNPTPVSDLSATPPTPINNNPPPSKQPDPDSPNDKHAMTLIPSHRFSLEITPTPAWAIQIHILAWFDNYQKTDHRPYISIITDLHNRKPPTWPSLDAYLTQKLITYRREVMTTALSDTLTTLRYREDSSQPPPQRYLSLPEIVDLIWSVLRQLVGESSHQDAHLLYTVLLSHPKAEHYTQPLQPGLTFSNQLFQQAYTSIKLELEDASGITPTPAPAQAPITVTLQLDPTKLQTLKHHLKNGSLGKLPMDIVAELYKQLETL